MQNANPIEWMLFGMCLYTLFRTFRWYVRTRGNKGPAKDGSANAQEIAAGEAFEAAVGVYRIVFFVLLWGRSLFMPDDKSVDIGSIVVGVGFIVLMILELIVVRRKERDQQRMEDREAEQQRRGHTRRAEDPTEKVE